MKEMVFIVIEEGKFPKTRKQLAIDAGKKSLTNMKLPVFYADENSKMTFTSLSLLQEYCRAKKITPRFVAAGK